MKQRKLSQGKLPSIPGDGAAGAPHRGKAFGDGNGGDVDVFRNINDIRCIRHGQRGLHPCVRRRRLRV